VTSSIIAGVGRREGAGDAAWASPQLCDAVTLANQTTGYYECEYQPLPTWRVPLHDHGVALRIATAVLGFVVALIAAYQGYVADTGSHQIAAAALVLGGVALILKMTVDTKDALSLSCD
jgi:hypothetical protein